MNPLISRIALTALLGLASLLLIWSEAQQIGGIVPVAVTQDKHSHVLSKHLPCVSFNHDFDALLNSSDQVFALMPAKAGGTSLKKFAAECFPETKMLDNFVNSEVHHKPFLLQNTEPPKFIASHLYSDRSLVDLIHYSARNTLLIYMYREETERLMSSIQYVVRKRLCSDEEPWVFDKATKETFKLNISNEECYFDEEPFVEHVIEQKAAEVEFSTASHLTCSLWSAVEHAGPNILFLDWRQSNVLQEKLAKHYCPHVNPRRDNVRNKDDAKKYMIRLGNGETMSLEDWIQAKRPIIEYTLKLSRGSCKVKTRKVQDAISSCPDKAIRVVSDESFW